MSLHAYLPQASVSPDELYTRFHAWAAEKNLELYPHQDEAILALSSGAHVILSTPTGSGKSLVATALHFLTLARRDASKGQCSFYTAPIKALVSEKFFALTELFGTSNVGMITGDSAINADAPIICCTAEILANIALREGAHAPIHSVVMDEFHYFADPQRGWAWQVPLLELPQSQFLLMSATLGDVSSFERELTRRTERPTEVVATAGRPVPLHHFYVDITVHESVELLCRDGKTPLYIVHFSQAEAVERAQTLTSLSPANPETKKLIAQKLQSFRFAPGFGATLQRFLRQGIGVHHAGMLPKYRRLVEQLAQEGLLPVICGTDTLGVGINVPIRTVLLTALSKYDGTRMRRLQVREFHQIAGRAGRAGFDTAGDVVIEAPEHVIENKRMLAKAQSKYGEDSKKVRNLVKKKPPKGFVSWSEETFERLRDGEPEPLASRMSINHAMIINLLARPGDSVEAGRKLLTDNWEPPQRQRALIRKALGITRELVAAGVIERVPPAEREAAGTSLRLTVDLPYDFALNQPLSPFALAALTLLDREASTYPLDVLSIIESVLENPRQVLAAQGKKARDEAANEARLAGLDYHERMAAIDETTYPQPLAELLEQAFDTYRRGAPWLADFTLEPKSVLRDMFERAMTFSEYVRFYGLARSEGVLLRYLSDAHRVLRQTVPGSMVTEELDDIIAWLGEVIRHTDSSLLDEWESLQNPQATREATAPEQGPLGKMELTSHRRAFTIMVRNEMFRRIILAARDDYKALGELDAASGWDAQAWEEALGRYWEEHESMGDGPEARSAALFVLDTAGGRQWRVRQIVDDPAGHHDWSISAIVDLDASDERGEPAIVLESFACS